MNLIKGNSKIIRVGILNLMPLKEVTENDFLRLFSGIEREVSIVWLRLRSHTPKHTSSAHMDALYTYIDELSSDALDGLIITGAPVEQLAFEDVSYWPELTQFFDWSRVHVRSTIYICWAAQAGLYHHYGIPKYNLPKKKFGIFNQEIVWSGCYLFKGFGRHFPMPHSRHTEIRREDIEKVKSLAIASESKESSVSIVVGRDGHEIFVTGHMEYAADTLHTEYMRDLGKRDDVDLPEHYYDNDDWRRPPLVTWQESTLLFYQNWIAYLLPQITSLELLAPAKNLECGKTAVDHGADAVYIGAPRFGARASAGNSIADIAELCRYAHQFGVKVYVTVNTIVYDKELTATRQLLLDLREAMIDAVLIQDMALISMCKEVGLPFHASTQTDNRTPEKVAWLRTLGFQRVVLARELSKEEINRIHQKVPDIELESFVHGALCVSYSGQCYASEHCFGRSANRGMCAQFCRMKFDLIDSDGSLIERQRHLLSLKDLCLIDHLEELADSGVVSFKIEGRLKDVDYVKNVVSAYSQRLNQLVTKYPECYQRASAGQINYVFEPNLKKTFNRGFTTYFLHGRQPTIASFDTPKAMGEYVGRVKELRGNSFTVSSASSFSNGDGLCFFNDGHELEGFRINRAEGNRLFPLKMPSRLKAGKALYRNHDVAFEKLLGSDTAERKIPVSMCFSPTIDGFSLTITANGHTGTSSIACEHQMAQKPQYDIIVRLLTKLGNTPFVCSHVEMTDGAERYFIPNSLLAELRRQAVSVIQSESLRFKQFDRSFEDVQTSSEIPDDMVNSSYLLNVANELARLFYVRQGLADVGTAFELSHPHGGLLMQCRHCIRYSLGYCVKHGGKKPRWHEPLSLRLSDGRQFLLEFDCKHCQMNVYAKDE